MVSSLYSQTALFKACLYMISTGAVLSSKSRSDQQLAEARLKARKIIHAFHKAQDRLDVMEVCVIKHDTCWP